MIQYFSEILLFLCYCAELLAVIRQFHFYDMPCQNAIFIMMTHRIMSKVVLCGVSLSLIKQNVRVIVSDLFQNLTIEMLIAVQQIIWTLQAV